MNWGHGRWGVKDPDPIVSYKGWTKAELRMAVPRDSTCSCALELGGREPGGIPRGLSQALNALGKDTFLHSRMWWEVREGSIFCGNNLWPQTGCRDELR